MLHAIKLMLVLAVVAGSYTFDLLEWFERGIMDLRFRAASTKASPNLVLIEIDEPSLRAIPVWPWPRRHYAEALRRLTDAGIGGISFDIDFSSRSNPEDDRILAEALRNSPVPVMLAVFRQPATLADGSRRILESQPLPRFLENASVSAFNVQPDGDGKVRRMFTRERWENRLMPHYAARLAGQHGAKMTRYYIDYAIDVNSIPRISFADVVSGRFDPALVRGRQVLIGASALQLGDMVTVPLYRSLPGMVVQALAYSTLEKNRAIQRLHPGYVLGLCLLGLVLLQLVGGGRGWKYSLAASLGLVATAVLGALGLQMRTPLYVDLAPLVLLASLDFLMRLVTMLRRQDIMLLTQSLALRRRDMFMRLVVENSFDAIFTTTPAGEVLTYNHAAEDVFGYTREEVIGHGIAGLLQDIKVDSAENLETLLTLRGIHEISCRRSDGGTLVLDISIGQIRAGEEMIVIFLARDITEKRNAETKARQAEANLAEAIESIDAGFALFGKDGILVLANRRYLDKISVASQLGSQPSYAEIIEALAKAGYFTGAREDAAAWTAKRLSNRHLDGDANIEQTTNGRWILTSARRTEDGGMIIVETDITALKEREAELIVARDEAESANRMKSEFLAAMSHELRTPLNAIIGFSEVMSTEVFGPLGSDNYTSYAKDIHSSGQHLLAIINDILDMAKIESGQFVLNETPVSLGETITGAVRLVRESAQAKNLTLEAARPEGGIGLMADARILRQILLNLLSNAIKFTPEGGCVDVTTARTDDGYAITVSDTGIGMSKEELVKALEPFGQVQGSLSRQYEGTGLGLPLVNRFAELHGARLDIDSTPGKGTRVTVTFPPERVLEVRARRGATGA